MTSCYQPLGVVEIHPASTDADLQSIACLAPLIWRHAFRAILSEAQLHYMLQQRYSMEALHAARASGSPAYLLLRVDGDPVGFAAHRATPTPKEWQLQQLYIHPDWQGRGLGKRLVAQVEACARAQGCSTLVLTVNRGNSAAQQSYLHLGFAIRSALITDIGQGFVMDDFVMAKPLNPHPAVD